MGYDLISELHVKGLSVHLFHFNSLSYSVRYNVLTTLASKPGCGTQFPAQMLGIGLR